MKKARSSLAMAIAVSMFLILTAGGIMSISPTARGYAHMTYDSESGQVVLFGGQTGEWGDPGAQSFETWLFNPETNVWTQMPSSSNPPDSLPSGWTAGDMTYNSKADRSILSVISGDWSTLEIWSYDDNSDTWTRMADGPASIIGQRIVYDAESDRVIMFGGLILPAFAWYDETWAYDYNTDTWTNMNPSVQPSVRNFQGMVYDSKADRVVMWGDWKYLLPSHKADRSVWTYDYNTNTWQEFEHRKDGPASRDYQRLAYDEKNDRIIMYGGYEWGNDETWIYDLNSDTWQQMAPVNNPGAISRYTMVYARDANKTILFGGQDGPNYYQYKGETWLYDFKRNKWTNAAEED